MNESHLNNSPIREAVIDFKFNFLQEVDISELEAAFKKLKAKYPTKEVMDVSSLFFDMSASNKPKLEHTKGKAGYRFISNEKDIIIQFRIDGFTFSKLKPYTSWDEIKEKIKEAYLIYLETVKVDKVIRIATRYINFIPLEENEVVDIKKYFGIYPNIPAQIDTPIDKYLMRVSFKNPTTGVTTIVNQGIVDENNFKNNTITKNLLLDIDCFQDKISIEPTECWDKLEEIKSGTNKLFFESITKFTKDKFE